MEFFENLLTPVTTTFIYVIYSPVIYITCTTNIYFFYPELNYELLSALCEKKSTQTLNNLWTSNSTANFTNGGIV